MQNYERRGSRASTDTPGTGACRGSLGTEEHEQREEHVNGRNATVAHSSVLLHVRVQHARVSCVGHLPFSPSAAAPFQGGGGNIKYRFARKAYGKREHFCSLRDSKFWRVIEQSAAGSIITEGFPLFIRQQWRTLGTCKSIVKENRDDLIIEVRTDGGERTRCTSTITWR